MIKSETKMRFALRDNVIGMLGDYGLPDDIVDRAERHDEAQRTVIGAMRARLSKKGSNRDEEE